MSCIFCDIINGTTPCHKLHEDAHTITILVPRPIREGHCIVIPKQHYDDFMHQPDALNAHTAIVTSHIAQKLKRAYNPLKIGTVVSGFGVSHVHTHVIPLHDQHDITSTAYLSVIDGQIIISENSCAAPSAQDQINTCEKIKNA